ncbi:MAG: CoA transferase [Dehalococcoidia bacterium]|nr:CoA transferase [Dehalococcoidia bacterium]
MHVLRNKKSFTVDSRRPEGLEVVKELIRRSHVIAENIALGTMAKLGLDDDAIREINPGIVIMHQPAFGLTGDYIEGRGYGSHIDAVAGGTALRGYRDSAPETNTQIFASDFVAGSHAAVALLAALRHQRRTGEGQVVEVAQVEAAAQMFPQSLMDAAWNGREHGSIGNRSVEGFVPNGVFRCAGDDNWIAISCRNDAEWHAPVEFLGAPGWAAGDDLATGAARAAHEDRIEAKLAAFCSARDQMELFHGLQAAGVTAGPVLNAGQAAGGPAAGRTGLEAAAGDE